MPEIYTQVSAKSVILTTLAVLLLAVFLGSIYALIRAVFLFVFSQGDQEKVKKAWSSLRFMIIGILVAFVVLIIFPLIFKRVGVADAQYFSVGNVLKQMKVVIQALLNMGDWLSRFYRGLENTPVPKTTDYTL